jgi:hypothetical protein
MVTDISRNRHQAVPVHLHSLVFMKETLQRSSSAITAVQVSMLSAARQLNEQNNILNAAILQIDESLKSVAPRTANSSSSVVQLFAPK